MKLKLLPVLFLSILILTSSFPLFKNRKKPKGYLYTIIDGKLYASQICGKKICDPGNIGANFAYTRDPFSPTVSEGSTVRDAALQVLGQTIPADELENMDYNPCSGFKEHPLTDEDIKPMGAVGGRSLDYKLTKSLNFNVKAAAEANIKQLMKITNDAAKIQRLEAKIMSAYQKLNQKNYTITGTYTEWGLTQQALRSIKDEGGLRSACRNDLKDNNRLITAVGIIHYDISFEQDDLNKLSSELDAELAKEGLNTSLSMSFKKEVNEKISANTKSLFQVVVINHATLKGNRFTDEFLTKN